MKSSQTLNEAQEFLDRFLNGAGKITENGADSYTIEDVGMSMPQLINTFDYGNMIVGMARGYLTISYNQKIFAIKADKV